MPAVTASLTQPLLKCCGPNLPFHNKCLYGAVGCRSARSPRQLVVHVGNSAALKLSCNVAARQPNGMKQFCSQTAAYPIDEEDAGICKRC